MVPGEPRPSLAGRPSRQLSAPAVSSAVDAPVSARDPHESVLLAMRGHFPRHLSAAAFQADPLNSSKSTIDALNASRTTIDSLNASRTTINLPSTASDWDMTQSGESSCMSSHLYMGQQTRPERLSSAPALSPAQAFARAPSRDLSTAVAMSPLPSVPDREATFETTDDRNVPTETQRVLLEGLISKVQQTPSSDKKPRIASYKQIDDKMRVQSDQFRHLLMDGDIDRYLEQWAVLIQELVSDIATATGPSPSDHKPPAVPDIRTESQDAWCGRGRSRPNRAVPNFSSRWTLPSSCLKPASTFNPQSPADRIHGAALQEPMPDLVKAINVGVAMPRQGSDVTERLGQSSARFADFLEDVAAQVRQTTKCHQELDVYPLSARQDLSETADQPQSKEPVSDSPSASCWEARSMQLLQEMNQMLNEQQEQQALLKEQQAVLTSSHSAQVSPQSQVRNTTRSLSPEGEALIQKIGRDIIRRSKTVSWSSSDNKAHARNFFGDLSSGRMSSATIVHANSQLAAGKVPVAYDKLESEVVGG